MLSGRFDALHLVYGVLASALVAWFSADLVFPRKGDGRFIVLVRWIAYLPWLAWSILRANLAVLRIVFHPRIEQQIDPTIVTFDTRLKDDLARMNLGNSITLTPGTLTYRINGATFSVHALTPELAEGLPDDMEGRVEAVFRGGSEGGGQTR